MSGRKLGGGRVLGSGKGLAPAAPSPTGANRTTSPAPPSSSNGRRHVAPSPPGSVTSVGTQNPLPGFANDLHSAVSLGAAGPSNGGSSASKLVCPICEEEMLTLLQLNRHIDDNHQELAPVEQDEVKTWFDKQVLKAKRFQPLSVINQKLRGLEVFESNEAPPSIAAPASTMHNRAPAPIAEMPFDPDDIITKSHWQRSGPNDLCTDPACGKRLGAVNGNINCRSCGRLFCEEHTMYQMKLSRAAKHEPVRGHWYRVCETCYKSREGYNDHSGLLRDHTKEFDAIRRKKVDKQTLEISRLEKRLSKLTSLLVNPPEHISGGPGGGGNLLSSVTSLSAQRNNQRKAIEQSVVTWEDDAKVARCPFCQQEFGSWTFRRHHCRMCGRVVCADPQTGCSSEVGLNVANPAVPTTEKPGAVAGAVSVDIRMCQDCKSTLFAKRDFEQATMQKPADQRAYETLRQFERGIQQILPNFQRALLPLQDENNPPSSAQIQEASKLRKRLTDSFTKYDVAARRIRDMKTDSPTQKALQKSIYAAASTFLHMHMLPLKNLPRMLKTNASANARGRLLPTSHVSSPLRNNSDFMETASQTSESSTVVSALESEEKDLKERLIVLEEQRYLVQTMIDNSQGARRFEEVSALTRNIEELDREIKSLKGKVSGVEDRWQTLYANGGPGSG
ncbi:FYVE zinc finger protein [Microdochium trichocladiopsis]|uniref:FYVE zinc finger protein n=1 Tax=Microdochium trichocladiopsis TaxID=1682393 RepID=A0A9P8YA93_9PEZI|nr:FYVE zinc finger protein [Microdochium trichocladiopsis]KAH7035944.1 FYVE zinc finger protein [Microdochium trichocladiopsis]